MTEDCVFCNIITGDIPSNTVYEDEAVYAFLDAQPLAKGHTLVIPKTHREHLHQLRPEEAATYFQYVPRIVEAVKDAVDADAATVAWNDGDAAGQEVPHIHLHIIPRRDNDSNGPVHALFDETPEVSDEERASLADRITDRL